MTNQQRVGAIIAAAGSSRRMDGVDKILAPLGGKPILARVIDAFEGCGEVNRIVIVTSEQNLKQCQQLVKEHNWPKVAGVGFERCLVPKAGARVSPVPKSIELISVNTLREAISMGLVRK